MLVIETKGQLDKVAAGQVLAIGNFDGVHTGHQELLRRAKAAGRDMGAKLTVMTFEPHPAVVLHPERAMAILSPLPMKRRLLEQCGVDCLIVIRDDLEVLKLSAQEFVDEFLMKHIRPRIIVEGMNFSFGAGRSGTVETLRQIGEFKGFDVITVEGKQVELGNGELVTVSSSLIRRLLEAGRVRDASIAMGRNYRLIGPTVAGRGVGTRIGFPTANLDAGRQVVPGEGVYAGFVAVGETVDEVCASTQRIEAAFSLGHARTFEGQRPRLIEAHILREDVGDLHGKWMGMEFVEFVRPQQKFENSGALVAQIAKDCKQIKKILTKEDTEKKQKMI